MKVPDCDIYHEQPKNSHVFSENEMLDLSYQISTLPFGDDGWTKSSGYELFMKAAIELITVGYSVDDAVDFLKEIYGAVASEYGE